MKNRKIEKMLREARPQPGRDLVDAIAATTRGGARTPARVRLAFAGGLSAAMLVAVGAVGGVSYAAEAFVGAAKTLEQAVSPSSARNAVVVNRLSAGSDQYAPGYGWGDENHTHTGPPGLTRRESGTLTARPNPRDTRFVRVQTAVNLDEQAQLSISVETAAGRELLISQRWSTVGRGVDGPSTKNVQYTVLVPRAGIPIDLSIPRNLLVPGRTYFIVVKATDPDGETRTLRIGFRA